MLVVMLAGWRGWLRMAAAAMVVETMQLCAPSSRCPIFQEHRLDAWANLPFCCFSAPNYYTGFDCALLRLWLCCAVGKIALFRRGARKRKGEKGSSNLREAMHIDNTPQQRAYSCSTGTTSRCWPRRIPSPCLGSGRGDCVGVRDRRCRVRLGPSLWLSRLRPSPHRLDGWMHPSRWRRTISQCQAHGRPRRT